VEHLQGGRRSARARVAGSGGARAGVIKAEPKFENWRSAFATVGEHHTGKNSQPNQPADCRSHPVWPGCMTLAGRQDGWMPCGADNARFFHMLGVQFGMSWKRIC